MERPTPSEWASMFRRLEDLYARIQDAQRTIRRCDEEANVLFTHLLEEGIDSATEDEPR